MYKIRKQQERINNYKFNFYYFKKARDSFEYILKNLLQDKIILIPAYIGYSSREGSGIFDPIKNSQINYIFYKFDLNLNIDLNYLYNLIKNNPNSVLLLVHYFGFLDKNINKIKEYAKDNGVTIIEDCAHSFFTFFKNPIIESDYYIFSLHKMFSYNEGGLLISKNSVSLHTDTIYNPFEYNIYLISKKRVENFDYLKEKVSTISNFKILHQVIRENIPQTFPILVESEELRDYLYFKLNEEGFGAVSLYHELINEINQDEYENEYYISKHILNLPIHQDVNREDIDKLVLTIKYLLKKGYMKNGK